MKNEPFFKIIGVTEYPPFIDEAAQKFGKERFDANTQNRENNQRYDRGDLNLAVDILGVQCEMIGQYVCRSAGYRIIQVAPLIDVRPVTMPDFVLSIQAKIDVKGVKPTTKDFYSNVENSKKQANKITHYLFVQPIGDFTARYCSFTYGEVLEWKVDDSKFTPMYLAKMPFKV